MILRAFYLTLCALVLAGIVHVAVVLLIPAVGTKDAYGTLSRSMEPFRFEQLSAEKGEGPISDVDPFFAYGVCRFELGETGLSLVGPDADLLWSATVVDQDGGVVYSLNSRTAISGRLDMRLLTPLLTVRLRETPTAEIENSILVETDMKGGFIVLRVFRPDETWHKAAGDFMEKVNCERYVPPAAGGEPVAAAEPAEG